MDLRECPSAEALMDMARARTGLDDFGDPARNDGLRAFVASLREETWTETTEPAREVMVDYVIHHLGNRLRLIADRKRHHEIAEQRIERPIIIVGPPRSGSTLMHNMLTQDPDNMAPEHWMCREPSPPLALGAPTQDRLDRAEQRIMALFALTPDVFVTHPYLIEEGSGALAECGSDIMNMAFTSQQLWVFWGGDSYRRYLLEADHSAAVGFHHDFLQHLQWGNPGKRWALKGSDHMLWLGELAAQYPEALLVWTHRDLAQQLASLASVQSIIRGVNGQPVTEEVRRRQGGLAIALQREAIAKAMRTRDAIGEHRFIDVSYHDLLSDPVAVVERIYARAGLAMSDVHRANIAGWLETHHQTKHGVHKHSPEEFGMEAEAINREFGDYVERFGFGFGIRPAPAV